MTNLEAMQRRGEIGGALGKILLVK